MDFLCPAVKISHRVCDQSLTSAELRSKIRPTNLIFLPFDIMQVIKGVTHFVEAQAQVT